MPKGDALVTYLLRPSVNIAVKVMHGRQFWPNRGAAMSVQEAQFEMKGEYTARVGNGSGNKGGARNEVKKKGASHQKEKLLGWTGFDDVQKASEVRCRHRESALALLDGHRTVANAANIKTWKHF
jgi:hypothetical protein